MKHQITQVLNRNLVADDTVAKLIQYMCFAASLVVLSLSLRMLLRLDLTDSQLFLSLLISPIVPMLLIVLGLLLPIASAAKKA